MRAFADAVPAMGSPGQPTKARLCSAAIRGTQANLPKGMSLFRSFNIKGSIDQVWTNQAGTGVPSPVPCTCAEIGARTGVPLVRGHIFTRIFGWLRSHDPSVGHSVCSLGVCS